MPKTGDALNGTGPSAPLPQQPDGAVAVAGASGDAASDYLEQSALLAGTKAPKFSGFNAPTGSNGGTDPQTIVTLSAGDTATPATMSLEGRGLSAAAPASAGIITPGLEDGPMAPQASVAPEASSGLDVHLVFDANALAAPQSFRNGMQAAANILDAAFSNPITVNIEVGFGEFDGGMLPNQSTSEGDFFFQGVEGEGISESYSSLRNLLAASATSADDTTSISSLPNTESLQGNSNVLIASSQAKAFGTLAANNSALDGIVGMGENFSGNVLISGALHEITHAMARIGGSDASEDLFRFTSAGTRLFNGNIPSPQAYFSIDDGVTNLANYGVNSDPSDFETGTPQTNNDPFDETVGNLGSLTSLDLEQMDVLGFTLASQTSTPTPTPTPTNLDTMTAGDFNHGGTSDTISFATDGTLTIYSTTNGVPVQAFVLGQVGTNFTFGAVGNFFGTGAASDFIMRGAQGQIELYQVVNDQIASATPDGAVGTDFQIVSVGDYFQTGTDAVLMRSTTTGAMELYRIQGGQITGASSLGAVGIDQQVVGQGNFFGDGTEDLLMEQNGTGLLTSYEIQNGQLVAERSFGAAGGDEHVVGVGDFNGDGISDLLMRQNNGTLRFYEIQNGTVANVASIGQVGLEFQPAGVGNFFGNGTSDFMMRSGQTVELYKIQNYQVAGASVYGQIGTNVQLAGAYFNHLV